MKRIWSVLTAAVLCISLVACSSGADQSAVGIEENSGSSAAVSEESTNEISQPDPVETPGEESRMEGENVPTSNEPAEAGEQKILIAYFTWADNTVVADPASVDVDATTSASVLVPGNTARMAGWIQQEVGGDLFQIITVEPYSSDYDECLDRAADEKAANARPALVNHLDNMDEYDVVFLGFPNWWYTVPMAIHTFLEEYDFTGKTVIPFVAHGTGGLASSVRDVTAALPNSTVLEPIGVYRPDIDTAQGTIIQWLDGLVY